MNELGFTVLQLIYKYHDSKGNYTLEPIVGDYWEISLIIVLWDIYRDKTRSGLIATW